jgi:hypothetical protein
MAEHPQVRTDHGRKGSRKSSPLRHDEQVEDNPILACGGVTGMKTLFSSLGIQQDGIRHPKRAEAQRLAPDWPSADPEK